MRLHKVDTSAWTVRAVEGEPWPGKDSDGDICFENTHFADEAKAWERLRSEAEAYIVLSGRAVHQRRDDLREAEIAAGRACEAFSTVLSNHRAALASIATNGGPKE